MLEVGTRPSQTRRRRSLAASAPVCHAHDPYLNSRTQSFLSPSVATRTDFEHARLLAGYIPPDEAVEVAEGRWLETGFCEVPTVEAYGVELLFAVSAADEVLQAKPPQLRQERDGTVHVSLINGLRFSLTRSRHGGDGFVVSHIAQVRVPTGAHVYISDPVVLTSVPEPRPERIHLHFAVPTPEGDKSLEADGLASNFGPSIASTSPAPRSFALTLPSVPLLPTLPSHHGCEISQYAEMDVDGKVAVVRRGHCSFALKSHLAALVGAKAVIVVNTSDEEELVPSMDEEDEAMTSALVPLVLVSNSTGRQLEDLFRSVSVGGEARVQPLASSDVYPETIVLGGYIVTNATSRP